MSIDINPRRNSFVGRLSMFCSMPVQLEAEKVDGIEPLISNGIALYYSRRARALCVVSLALCSAAPPAGWRLVWHDEFDGPSVNASNWNVYANVSECSEGTCAGNQIELCECSWPV